MEALRNMYKRAKELEKKLFYLTFSDPRVQDMVIKLNTEGQLGEGLLSTGESLPEYSVVSLDLFDKPSFGKKDNKRIRLYNEGEFWRTFEVINVTNQYFTIWADGRKDGVDLFQKYSVDVAGLTDESIAILVEEIQDIMVEIILEYVLQDN